MNVAKDLKPLFMKAKHQGFVIERRKKFKVICPDGSVFGVSATPSDRLSYKRIVADFRRHGLEV